MPEIREITEKKKQASIAKKQAYLCNLFVKFFFLCQNTYFLLYKVGSFLIKNV